jgi:hypothetical protein
MKTRALAQPGVPRLQRFSGYGILYDVGDAAPNLVHGLVIEYLAQQGSLFVDRLSAKPLFDLA